MTLEIPSPGTPEPSEEESNYERGAVLRPLKAIRAKCLDCVCGQYSEVRKCPCNACPLWPYRFGRRPTPDLVEEYTNAVGDEDQLAGKEPVESDDED